MGVFYVDPTVTEALSRNERVGILLAASMVVGLIFGSFLEFSVSQFFSPEYSSENYDLGQGVGMMLGFNIFIVSLLGLFVFLPCLWFIKRCAKKGFFGIGAAVSVGVLISGGLGFVLLSSILGIAHVEDTFALSSHITFAYGLPTSVCLWMMLAKRHPELGHASLGNAFGLWVLLPVLLVILFVESTFWWMIFNT